MADERRPVTPVARGRVPTDSDPYRVRDGDSWASIARQHGMDPRDLIYANFQTRDPREVNWYLREYVGCRTPTADGHNWQFSSSARPGIIYIPRRRVRTPAPPPAAPPAGPQNQPTVGRLRRQVSELMIYDVDDEITRDVAAGFLAEHEYGAWTVAARGVHGVGELTAVLDEFVNVEQITFETHGAPGRAALTNVSLTVATLTQVAVRPNLFRGAGRLLFLGCDVGRGSVGEHFLAAAGRHFFAGKGGVVGGSTISTLGFSAGVRLPVLGPSSGGWELGKLVILQLDARGNVVTRQSVRPFGL